MKDLLVLADAGGERAEARVQHHPVRPSAPLSLTHTLSLSLSLSLSHTHTPSLSLPLSAYRGSSNKEEDLLVLADAEGERAEARVQRHPVALALRVGLNEYYYTPGSYWSL